MTKDKTVMHPGCEEVLAMPKGIPTPMEDVPPKETRDHAWHWGTILDASPRPGGASRVPVWGGLVVAVYSVTGLAGAVITYAVLA